MRDLDLDHLRSFVAVCESGSLTAAAPKVFLSPSSISEQLAKLEARLGLVVLTRGRQGAVPTAHGMRLLGHAHALLALHDAALHDMTGPSVSGDATLAISDYYRPSDIARLLRRLVAAHPALRLRVIVARSGAIDAGLTSEPFDLGLSMHIGPHPRERSARALHLRRERLLWVTAATGLAPFERPLPIITAPEGCSVQAFTVRVLASAGVAVRFAHAASGVAGVQMAVAAGLGIACLNESSLTPELRPCDPSLGLPPLPEAEFRLLPPRRGEAPRIAALREAIRQWF